ncbi:hypothetical protein glysoja_007828 [Glycine soja]|nr:hypothetical protein glysoja_007828 [Glycine soja]
MGSQFEPNPITRIVVYVASATVCLFLHATLGFQELSTNHLEGLISVLQQIIHDIHSRGPCDVLREIERLLAESELVRSGPGGGIPGRIV